MSDVKRLLITEQQYEDIRAYEKTAQFDYKKLKAKYRDPLSDYPTKISISTDVVIAGGGPSGLMYALYLVQRGYQVIVIEPQEIGSTSRDWNISIDELMRAKCILSEEEIAGCIEGCIASRGSIQFRDLFTYRCREVLDRIVNPEKFLKLLAEKVVEASGRTAEELFFKTRYDNFRVKKDRICVLTADGRTVEADLFLHGMGSQDEISRFANHGMKRTWYNTVGIRARIGNTVRPAGDLLCTLEDASYGANRQQILWQLFRSDEPESNCATIYIFTMDREPQSLSTLMHYFEGHIEGYLQAEVMEVRKILYGYISLPDDLTGIKRSIFPRVYSIGENSINSVATGCGFAMCIKNLDHIGSQLVRTLKKGKTSPNMLRADQLNNLKPDLRQLCTVSIEQLFKEMVMRAGNEPVDKPNKHSATMFRLFSLIPDERGRNDMLKCIIRPHLFLPALLKVAADEEISMSDFFDALRSNNRGLFQRLRLIFRNYWILIFCEIREVIRHCARAFKYQDGELAKSRNHLRNLSAADPVRFLLLHRLLVKEAGKHKTEKISTVSFQPTVPFRSATPRRKHLRGVGYTKKSSEPRMNKNKK